jgi:hypothetical protein
MKRLLYIILLVLAGQSIYSQKTFEKELLIAYYNADQMYDYFDNEGAYDDDFTAKGTRSWGEQRYNAKLDGLADIIGSINGKELPGIIILGEIENKEVLKDLLDRKVFRKSGYSSYFYTHPGGKSIAILSSVDVQGGIETSIININGLNPEQSASIFHSTFVLDDGNIYHLFINNWTDRTSGLSGSEPSRINCAVALRKEIDKILNFERDARILVAGTFNDEPTNRSVLMMLNASNKRKNLNYRDLYNPFYDAHNENAMGTVSVNGSMQMYDFIIVSPQLLKRSDGYSTGFSSGKVFSGDRAEPLPTFRGDTYTEGPGTHFPVYIKLSRPVKK